MNQESLNPKPNVLMLEFAPSRPSEDCGSSSLLREQRDPMIKYLGLG